MGADQGDQAGVVRPEEKILAADTAGAVVKARVDPTIKGRTL
jgi:hypothetical protein